VPETISRQGSEDIYDGFLNSARYSWLAGKYGLDIQTFILSFIIWCPWSWSAFVLSEFKPQDSPVDTIFVGVITAAVLNAILGYARTNRNRVSSSVLRGQLQIQTRIHIIHRLVARRSHFKFVWARTTLFALCTMISSARPRNQLKLVVQHQWSA
jgi:hypothetical protein